MASRYSLSQLLLQLERERERGRERWSDGDKLWGEYNNHIPDLIDLSLSF